MAPVFWIVAGPNGAGKTTLTRSGNLRHLLSEIRHFINPDDVAAELLRRDGRMDGAEASLNAAQICDLHVDQLIERRESLLVETVLSSDKYRNRILKALRRGFHFRFIYVALQNPVDHVRRVHQRVEMGGHYVPIEKIKKRWARSMENLPWFARHATMALLFDNSEIGHPVLVAMKINETWQLRHPGRNPALDRIVRKLQNSNP